MLGSPLRSNPLLSSLQQLITKTLSYLNNRKFHGKTTKKYIKYLLTNVLFFDKAKPQKWCNLACWKSCSKKEKEEEHTLNNWTISLFQSRNLFLSPDTSPKRTSCPDPSYISFPLSQKETSYKIWYVAFIICTQTSTNHSK